MTASKFQSTLPTRGSDRRALRSSCASAHFNPRSPRGGATCAVYHPCTQARISIHAPHEGERPDGHAPAETRGGNFNPRSPRGGATDKGRQYRPKGEFQSTLPTMGSDLRRGRGRRGGQSISIHAPHEGERPVVTGLSTEALQISIHAPHEGERPAEQPAPEPTAEISIHAPHEGERPGGCVR